MVDLKSKLQTLPLEPGCYLMKDKFGEVIYVGKAKKLKNRVNSYFTGSHNNKTTKLVANINDFEYIVAPSEKEALVLEYNLIKQYKPKFNIMFMDDASYPYIRLTMDDNPTIKLVRDKKKLKNARYFGPFPNAGYARDLVSLLEKLYPLRKCKNMPAKVCLYYHLGMCLGPCEYKIEKSVYEKLTNDITRFLNGDTKEIRNDLIEKRNKYAQNLQFEQAKECQDLILAIEHVTSDQNMQFNSKKKEDVFNYFVYNGFISIVGLLYRDGKLLHRHLLVKQLYDEPEEEFISYLTQYYASNQQPKVLHLPKDVDITSLAEVLNCEVHQPQRGDKVKLIELAKENAQINIQQKFEIVNKEANKDDLAIEQLRKITGCDCHRIELYDNSHTSGTYSVAGMVVYLDGIKSSKDYRLFKVHNGNDDYGNMQEVLYRRLFRAVKENTVLPDMIIVDGGVSQINAAKDIIASLGLKIDLFGLVKNDKHSTASLMNKDLNIIPVDRDCEAFFLLTRMQDEVHRFAISYHKKLRSQGALKSELDDIEGIGPKRKNALQRKFGSLKKLKAASLEQLTEVLGPKQAKIVYDYLQSQEG